MQPDAEGSHRDSAGGRVTTDSLPCSLFVPPQRIDILPPSAAHFGMPTNMKEVNATNLRMPINMELPPATDFGMSTYMKEVNAADFGMPTYMKEVNAACFPMSQP